ncbi:ImmA/IrrE family metallo-endopeptidase [Paenibacillus soyae]|uniref:ImmA/IrrE family metallo-endopeptidase n=1 Tax=Paenibacillus soyae TaxID=2969249 RepID=A0A9X2MV98_9BACL|nr:ImmA/IrrE family metallo-endopeptidase [Paenibacillus soyae]MCR2804207.1 ImmA/IrrE family metallo-endopeptidase [Paenibacillus soyae]
MEPLNFELYRPSDLELWIQDKFQGDGLNLPGDLEDWDRIAALFGAHIAYTEGETKVMYDEDGDCLIFLNIHMDKLQQKLAFFHELSHPALHAGNQLQMPSSFVALQETQAGLFQLYSAMPLHMLRAFAHLQQQPHDLRLVAEAFDVPLSFARRRLDRIAGRIRQEHEDRRLRARLADRSSLGQDSAYSELTSRLLHQLYQQTRNASPKKGSIRP